MSIKYQKIAQIAGQILPDQKVGYLKLVVSNQWPKIYHRRQRRAANHHIWEAGKSRCRVVWKETPAINQLSKSIIKMAAVILKKYITLNTLWQNSCYLQHEVIVNVDDIFLIPTLIFHHQTYLSFKSCKPCVLKVILILC